MKKVKRVLNCLNRYRKNSERPPEIEQGTGICSGNKGTAVWEWDSCTAVV